MTLVSKSGYWHTVPAERPSYGKRRKPIFTPRIKARRMMARMLYHPRFTLRYRIMIMRRLFR